MANYNAETLQSIGTSIGQQLLSAKPFASFDFDDAVGGFQDLNAIPIGLSRVSLNQLIKYFNVSEIPDIHNMAMPLFGYIFFTRPSLYLDPLDQGPFQPGAPTYVSASMNPAADWGSIEYNTAAFAQHPMTSALIRTPMGRKLLSQLCEGTGTPYMPLFTTRATNYTAQDFSLRSIEVGKTFYGQSVRYAHFNDDHKAGGTITIEFRNDYHWSILRTIYLWMAYIYLVTKTDLVRPKRYCETCGILDYCGSIYLVLTQLDRRTIVYWEKLTGVYPKTAPFSIFSYSDAPLVNDKISIEFEYALRSDPYDADVLFDLNLLSGSQAKEVSNHESTAVYLFNEWTKTNGYGTADWNKLYTNASDNAAPYHVNDVLSRCPVINSNRDANDGSLGYYLEWRRDNTMGKDSYWIRST